MTPEEVEKLDDQGLAAWNDHDPDAFVGLLADGFVIHDWTVPQPITDKDGARAYVNGWISAFPDMKLRLLNAWWGTTRWPPSSSSRGRTAGRCPWTAWRCRPRTRRSRAGGPTWHGCGTGRWRSSGPSPTPRA